MELQTENTELKAQLQEVGRGSGEVDHVVRLNHVIAAEWEGVSKVWLEQRLVEAKERYAVGCSMVDEATRAMAVGREAASEDRLGFELSALQAAKRARNEALQVLAAAQHTLRTEQQRNIASTGAAERRHLQASTCRWEGRGAVS